MSVERFALDTNVLVYAIDNRAARKQEVAREVIARAAATQRCVISTQSIGEFYVASRRKGLAPAGELERTAHDYMRVLPVVGVTGQDAGAAMASARSAQLSYWDALMLATAARVGCDALLSEDMQDGFTLGRVTVRNPFVGSNLPQQVAELLLA